MLPNPPPRTPPAAFEKERLQGFFVKSLECLLNVLCTFNSRCMSPWNIFFSITAFQKSHDMRHLRLLSKKHTIPAEVYSEQDRTFRKNYQIYWIKFVDVKFSLEQWYGYIIF